MLLLLVAASTVGGYPDDPAGTEAEIRPSRTNNFGEVSMKIQGNVIRYGDHVDTDVIIPVRYLNTSDAEELAAHCMEDLDPQFREKSRSARLIVAGENFGCGSSREHAPIAIKAAGIQAVVAKSFARIFYRNAINIGLPIVECPQLAECTEEGDLLSIDLDTGTAINLTRQASFSAAPFPPFIQEIIAAGGLLAMRAKQNRD